MMEIKASRKSNPRMAFVWRLRFAASSWACNCLLLWATRLKWLITSSFSSLICKKYGTDLCSVSPGVNFTNMCTWSYAAFMCEDPKSAKKTVKSSVSFFFLRDLQEKNLLVKCWWNQPWCQFSKYFASRFSVLSISLWLYYFSYRKLSKSCS
jgi:hypothetical protein